MSDEHEFLPATSWILDKVVTEPAENLPAAAAIPYFVVGAPVIGLGALAGYAVDEYNHYVVEPATASLERLAEITGVTDAIDAAVHETASTMVDMGRLTVAAAQHIDPATTHDPAVTHDGVTDHADPVTTPDPATAADPYADATCHPDPAGVPDPAATGDADDGGICPADTAGGDPGTAMQ